MIYKINKNYFDKVDSQDKAYWLGFIWADGYISKRERVGRIEYCMKISVSEIDKDHLHKFKTSTESTHPIKYYELSKGSFPSDYKEARFFISSLYMCEILYNDYGIIPRRSNVDKTISKIPKEYMHHFIRGIFDGDGSFSYYLHKETQKKGGVQFTTSPCLLDIIEENFIEAGLCADFSRKHYKRHKEENKDVNCRTLGFSGVPQSKRILDYLYTDSNGLYLDRKHDKYIQFIKDFDL